MIVALNAFKPGEQEIEYNENSSELSGCSREGLTLVLHLNRATFDESKTLHALWCKDTFGFHKSRCLCVFPSQYYDKKYCNFIKTYVLGPHYLWDISKANNFILSKILCKKSRNERRQTKGRP